MVVDDCGAAEGDPMEAESARGGPPTPALPASMEVHADGGADDGAMEEEEQDSDEDEEEDDEDCAPLQGGSDSDDSDDDDDDGEGEGGARRGKQGVKENDYTPADVRRGLKYILAKHMLSSGRDSPSGKAAAEKLELPQMGTKLGRLKRRMMKSAPSPRPKAATKPCCCTVSSQQRHSPASSVRHPRILAMGALSPSSGHTRLSFHVISSPWQASPSSCRKRTAAFAICHVHSGASGAAAIRSASY